MGWSFSSDFPTTRGAYDRVFDSTQRTGVIVKVQPDASATPTASTRYAFDVQGNRVKPTINGVATHYAGAYFEREGNSTRKSYYFGGSWWRCASMAC